MEIRMINMLWVKVCAGILLVGIVMYLFGSCGKQTAHDEYVKWTHERDSVFKENKIKDIQIQVSDSIAKIKTKKADSLSIAGKRIHLVADSMKKVNATLLQKVQDMIPVADTCKPQIDSLKLAISNEKNENDSLRVSNTLLLNSNTDYRLANLAFFRSDSILKLENNRLNAVISLVPVPPKEKLLGFISLPNRKTSFIIGGMTVIVLQVAAHNGLHIPLIN
jgi:hypothetical protein